MTDQSITVVLRNEDFADEVRRSLAMAHQSVCVLAYAISPARAIDSRLKPSVFSAMCAAAERKLPCFIVIADHPAASPYQQQNNQSAVLLTQAGWTVRRHPVRPLMHCKAIIFDKRHCIIGSHNLTAAALDANRELSLHSFDPDATETTLQCFDTIYRASTPHGQNIRAS